MAKPRITEQTTLGELQLELSKHGVEATRAYSFHGESKPVWVSVDNREHQTLGKGATLAEALCAALDELVARVRATLTDCERSAR